MRRVLVFDVDNTLTPPRRPLAPPMAARLCRLAVPFHLAAGSDLALVQEQVLEPLATAGFRGSLDAFVCNGADRYRCRFAGSLAVERIASFRLRDHLGDANFTALLAAIEELLEDAEFSLAGSGVAVRGPRIIDRGSMINVAPMGRPTHLTAADHANRAAFVAFDRATGYRTRFLARLQAAIAPWRERYGLRLTLGGQTSFDLVVEGFDKSFPLRALLAEGADEVLYFGDALHPHGNDSVVLEFIERWPGPAPCPVRAIPVAGWEDTLARLAELEGEGERPARSARRERA